LPFPGIALLENFLKDLKAKYRKGFSRRNVLDMRRFYLIYRKWQTVSAELSWNENFACPLSLSSFWRASAKFCFDRLPISGNRQNGCQNRHRFGAHPQKFAWEMERGKGDSQEVIKSIMKKINFIMGKSCKINCFLVNWQNE